MVGLCSFEVLIEEYQLTDPSLAQLAQIVHGADIEKGIDTTPESTGLLAIAHGFALLDVLDQRQLELNSPYTTRCTPGAAKR